LVISCENCGAFYEKLNPTGLTFSLHIVAGKKKPAAGAAGS
jgi:hypothetical protein